MAKLKELFGGYKVEHGTKFHLEKTTLYNLYLLGSFGVNGEEPEINSAHGFLQRLAQKTEWNQNDKKRAKSYIQSLIKGSNLLDNFVLIPIDLLLKSVENNMVYASGEELKAWESVIAYIEEHKEKGAKVFIIDGQNRLNEAIIPFFDSNMALPQEAIVFRPIDKDGKPTGKAKNIANKLYKELPKGIQEYIKDIEIPLIVADAGDIKQFSAALIWKNEGIAWDAWQKLITNQWYTKFRRQLSSIASEDDGDPQSIEALKRISGAKYMYDVNGLDLIVAELLAWMVTAIQPTKVEDFDSYFNGTNVITQTQIDLLKKYLREFDSHYDKKLITNVELRNYVMLRYVIDNPNRKEFDKLAIPSWKINKGTAFAGIYKTINNSLVKDPVKLGEKPSYEYIRPANGGKSIQSKVPGSYVWSCSKSGPLYIENRLTILLNVLQNANDKTPKSIIEDLHKYQAVIELDTDAMPDMEQLYMDEPYDNKGVRIPISTLKSANWDRGHKSPKSKGGSNTDLVLQKGRENKIYGDKYEHDKLSS